MKRAVFNWSTKAVQGLPGIDSGAPNALLFCLHNIIADGWIDKMLIRLQTFTPPCGGEPVDPESRASSIGLCGLANKMIGCERSVPQSYWLDQFKGESPYWMPFDFPRQKMKSYAVNPCGLRLTTSLPGKSGIDPQRCEHASLFMLLFGAVNILLHNIPDRNDLIVGTIAGRNHYNWKSLRIFRHRGPANETDPDVRSVIHLVGDRCNRRRL